MTSTSISTGNFTFVLPKGLIDDSGESHREGIMRLATAKDELEIQKDRRLQEVPGYEILLRLARVILKIGTLSKVTPEHLENLFVLDLAYLREFYNRINQQGNPYLFTKCPQCNSEFSVNLSRAGESQATP